MLNAITHTGIFVLDQDEALDFYVNTLGLELVADADLGNMRWLTVKVPGSDGPEILLERPAPPVYDEQTAAAIRDLVTKGAMGLTLILTTDDIHRTYAELTAKGVEFTEEPTERFYGTDCGFRDPFGNNHRLGQPKAGPYDIPPGDEIMSSY